EIDGGSFVATDSTLAFSLRLKNSSTATITGHVRIDNLSMLDSTECSLTPGSNSLFIVETVQMDDNTNCIDLRDNDLIIDYPGPIAYPGNLKTLLLKGRTTGYGITS